MSALVRSHFIFAFILFPLLTLPATASGGEDWPPITPEELKMTTEPKAPGSMAIYLYRQIDRDDVDHRENVHERIKIFSEGGRKFADIELPFVKDFGDIKNIQARTIHPDGTIINFDGKVYESTVVKAKGIKYLAKTFSMPDVQPGSIIEYSYTRLFPTGWIYDSRWILSEELFTKYAKFSLRQNTSYALVWSWPRGLPPGTNPPAVDHNIVRLETHDVPAFPIEDYMPPIDEMKYRVEFTYTRDMEKDPDKYWKAHAKALYAAVDAFSNRRKAMEQAVSQITSPSDSPEQKLQKLYATCQKIRNTSYETEKTQKELDREKLKTIQNVEDIWKRGYGGNRGINWLFLALARAAGFDVSPVFVCTRDRHFFNPKLINADELNVGIVLVKLNGKELYFDPGVPFAPFGVLTWSETQVQGLVVDKEGGTWVTIPLPDPAFSGIERVATLQLDDTGTLEGKVTLTFKGLSALWRRIDESDDDDTQKRKSLEDELRSSVPVAADVELTNKPDWKSSSNSLVAEFNLKVPGWSSAVGKRTLLPVELFGAGEKHLFETATRVHPIYISYPYTDADETTIALPLGWQIYSQPQEQHLDAKACRYDLTTEKKTGSVRVSRHLMMNLQLVDVKYYSPLHDFFQKVRTGDDQQILLTTN